MQLGHLSAEAAHELYLNMIIYTHGLAVLLCSGAQLSEAELAERSLTAFKAFAIAVGGKPGGSE